MSEVLESVDLLADPFIAQLIDEAVKPYLDSLDAQEIMWMRERLVEQLRHDPALTDVLDAAYPRDVDSSGERVKAWLDTTREIAAITGTDGGDS